MSYQLNQNQSSFFHTVYRAAVFCLVAVVFASGQAARSQAGEPQSMRERLCELVELAKNKETRAYASDQLAALSQYAPNDTNIPYLHALVMADNYKYRDAVAPAELAVFNQTSNPDDWRLKIWLTITVSKDFDDGLRTLEELAVRMNSNGQIDADIYQSLQIADFMGRVFGFLAGPAEMDQLQLSISEQRMTSYLTTEQNNHFNRAKMAVLDEFLGRSHEIADQRMYAQQTEDLIRNKRLSNSSEEREYLRSQMEQIENHRMQARQISSSERNVIAATRGSGYSYPRRWYGHYGHGLGYGYSHGYSQYERGLGNLHYSDVNRREDEFNRYLSHREQNLRRRMNRLQKDDERLLRKPNTGNSREVRSSSKTAVTLRTYVPFPVNTKTEIERILAMY